jgi:hypothetical protein
MKYIIKKFNGDDETSWAIFRAQDVKEMRSTIVLGDACPVMRDLDRFMAEYNRDRLNAEVK